MPDEPVRAVIDTPSCPVCKDHYEPTRKPRMFVECGHDSCTQCIIDMKAAGRHRCPMCNVPVKMEPNLPIMWSIIGSGPSSRVAETLRPGIKVKSEWTVCAIIFWATLAICATFLLVNGLLDHLEFGHKSQILHCDDYGESTNGHACWADHPPFPRPKPNPNNLCHTNTPLTTTRIVDKKCVDTLSPALKLSILRMYYNMQSHAATSRPEGMDRYYCFWEIVGATINRHRQDPSWASWLRNIIIKEFQLTRSQQDSLPAAGCLIKVLLNEIERRASWLQYETNCVKNAFTNRHPRYPEIRLDQHPFRAISEEYAASVSKQCAGHMHRLAAAAEARQAQIDEYKAPNCDLIA